MARPTWIKLRDIEKPQPGNDELPIRVQAAGIDPQASGT